MLLNLSNQTAVSLVEMHMTNSITKRVQKEYESQGTTNINSWHLGLENLKVNHINPTLFLQWPFGQGRASLFRKHHCTQALPFSFMSVLINEDWWLSRAPLWLVSCHGPAITASATAALLLHNIQHRLWKHPASPLLLLPFISQSCIFTSFRRFIGLYLR